MFSPQLQNMYKDQPSLTLYSQEKSLQINGLNEASEDESQVPKVSHKIPTQLQTVQEGERDESLEPPDAPCCSILSLTKNIEKLANGTDEQSIFQKTSKTTEKPNEYREAMMEKISHAS